METKKASRLEIKKQVIMQWSLNQMGLETKANAGMKAKTHDYKAKPSSYEAKLGIKTK